MRNLKKVLSLTLALVMLIGMMVVGAGATSFKDADQIKDEYKIAAAVLEEIGVMEGTTLNGETNFNPKKALTRVEGAALIYRVFTSGLSKNPAGESGFTDVDGTPNHGWASGTVAACRDLGIVSGVSATSFNPGGELTGSAFAKMLLVTLGYESDKQGYEGEGWAANVARDARTRGILLEAQNMNTVLTREEAAQMTLQALTADTMEYTGMNITTPDGTSFSTPATVRKYDSVNGTTGGGKTYNDVDIKPATTPIKLCEEKFPALKLVNTEDETFGRAQEVWTWKNVEITGTKTNVEPDAVFTAETKEAGVKKEIGKAVSEGSLFTNGQEQTGWDGKKAENIAKLTGNGRVVEVYLGKDDKATITKVIVVDTALGEVTKVDAKNEKITIKLERVDGDKTVEGAPALTTEVGYNEFKKGDIVLVQGYYNSTSAPKTKLNSKTTVTSVVEAPKVVGLARQKNYSDETITVDGEARKMSYGWVKDYGFTDFAVNNTYDCTLYLDNYDNIIKAIKGAKTNVAEDNLIAVNDVYNTLESGKIVKKASGVLSNGETETLTVPDGHANVAGNICTKTKNTDGTYSLAPVGTVSGAFDEDDDLYVAQKGSLSFSDKDSYGRGYGSGYMYADDVKFIFVESDGNVTVLNGRQSHQTSSKTWVAQAARVAKRNAAGDAIRYEIVAVFIGEQPDMVDISDIIYVHKGSSETTQVSDDVVDDKDGSRKTIYGYVAYDSNGEPIENFYGTKDNMAHRFFRKNTTTIGDYTVYKDTHPTSLTRHTVEDATVKHQNGLRGDAFVIGDGTRFLGGGAKLVDLSGKWIEDVSELNEMADEFDVRVSVIYNSNSNNDGTVTALTIFVESVTEKTTSDDAIWGTGADRKTEATLTTVNESDDPITIPAGYTLTVKYDVNGDIDVKAGGKLIVKGNMHGTVTTEAGTSSKPTTVEINGNVTGEIDATANVINPYTTIKIGGDIEAGADITADPQTKFEVAGEFNAPIKVKVTSQNNDSRTGPQNNIRAAGGYRLVQYTADSWSDNSGPIVGDTYAKIAWNPLFIHWGPRDGVTAAVITIWDGDEPVYQEGGTGGVATINTQPLNTSALYWVKTGVTSLTAGHTYTFTVSKVASALTNDGSATNAATVNDADIFMSGSFTVPNP